MDFNKFVFEIPIYRNSNEQFELELLNSARKIIQPKNVFKDLFEIDLYEKKYEEHLKKMILHKRYLWEYNEICGYIGLYFLFTQVRAEYYSVNTKRLRKGFTKKIEWVGKYFEINLIGSESSIEIYKLIEDELILNMQTPFLKNRFLDLTKFTKIGKHVNWNALINENN